MRNRSRLEFTDAVHATQYRQAGWPAFCSICREKAKTTGPALALANNANPANAERRFHARVIAGPDPAVKTQVLPPRRILRISRRPAGGITAGKV
jgi:hypothetical protein